MIEQAIIWDGIRISVSILVCFVAYFAVKYFVQKSTGLLKSRLQNSSLRVINFFLLYAIYALIVGITLNIAGFNIAALLGAAGVFGVAIGFAAQTTFSNVISGVFLMLEHSLRVGDVIAFDGTQGRIQELGLLAFTLKTIDNKLVRVPNELLIKSRITNVTARRERIISFTASAKDSQAAIKVFRQAWNEMQLAIKEKEINISYDACSADMVGFSISIWVKTTDIVAAKSEYIELCSKASFEQEIPLYISIKS